MVTVMVEWPRMFGLVDGIQGVERVEDSGEVKVKPKGARTFVVEV